MKSKTIVFIHGMFMTSLCWEKWIPYFHAKGYRALAPGWPGVRDLWKNSVRRTPTLNWQSSN